MHRIYFVAALTLCLLATSSLLLSAAQPSSPTSKAIPRRGIAVLASSIGSDYSPETLASIVRQWNFSPVVIDWAWITAHWDRTNFAALNRFVDLMAARGVPVAAMYRPRFLNNPTVPVQVDQTGKPASAHGSYICFSSPQARQWGISWGTQILQKCPRINEIIIYNPLNQCQCPACQEAARNNPNAHYDAVWKFMAEAKAAWQKQRPGAKLGVVYVNDLEFWRRGAQIIDIAHPFLFITNDTDMAKDAREASAIRDLLPDKMGSCLAKITWGENDKVSPARLEEFDRTAALAGLPYFIWTFETLTDAKLYDQKAVAQILRNNQFASSASNSQLAPAKPLPGSPPQQVVTQTGKPPAAQNIPAGAAALLKQLMESPDRLAAIDPLIKFAKESDADSRGRIIAAIVLEMNDKRRQEYPRWLCLKVLSGIGDERAVPELIGVLLHDESEIVRSVAAESVGIFYKNFNSSAAHEGLLQSGRQETSPPVREVLAQYLGTELPAAQTSPSPAAAPASAPATAVIPTNKPAAGLPIPAAGNYTLEQIQNTSTETFLAYMLNPEPGHNQFDALNALTEKAKQSDPAAREQIFSVVIKVMLDKNRPIYQRWQCCYVLSGTGDEQVVPYLIQALPHDDSNLLQGVAAEALSAFPKNAAAREALHKEALTSQKAREVLQRRWGEEVPASATASSPAASLTPGPAPSATMERTLTSSAPPPAWAKNPVSRKLPWPFPGNEEDQHIFNNYQQATDVYIHCGLDFIQPKGTPVMAVDSGYVAAIFTNYPQWVTHHCFIITPKQGGDVGWCYTHLDPRTFTFKEGDYIRQGQKLGELVDFSVGNQPGVAHLHLNYVKFTKEASGKVNTHSLLDPLYFFDWKDTEPPTFQPLRFVREDTVEEFPADSRGMITVNGRVDILAAIADGAYPDHMGNLGVPVVMYSISDGKHTVRKLALDHRGDVGDETQVKPLYLSYEERKVFFDPDSFPRYQMLRVTKTDGDGKITPRDNAECWDTTALDSAGHPLWPDGQYSVKVYAWDIAGNQGVVEATVRVRNK